MERNRWETAIRCLEVAVHPNTNDEEIVAAINGFRRTADGMPLSLLCREFAGTATSPVPAAASQDKLDRLSRENLELRQKIKTLEAERAELAGRLHAVEQQASDKDEELRSADARADIAEQRLAEFQAMYGRISGGLHHENLDLRRALDDAKRPAAEPAPRTAAAPFQLVLTAARQRIDQTPMPASGPASARPWTA